MRMLQFEFPSFPNEELTDRLDRKQKVRKTKLFLWVQIYPGWVFWGFFSKLLAGVHAIEKPPSEDALFLGFIAIFIGKFFEKFTSEGGVILFLAHYPYFAHPPGVHLWFFTSKSETRAQNVGNVSKQSFNKTSSG